MMKLFVTGGFAGWHTSPDLREEGERLRACAWTFAYQWQAITRPRVFGGISRRYSKPADIEPREAANP
jgi:nucleoside-diphosphate-sugar epimerase